MKLPAEQLYPQEHALAEFDDALRECQAAESPERLHCALDGISLLEEPVEPVEPVELEVRCAPSSSEQ
jgi:hypothetical protein